ncbi:hypothetical protein Dimus_017033 [Dionaea muscipula]
MFLRKLVEKATKKGESGGGTCSESVLKPGDVNPRVTFHYGIPSGGIMFAYDSIQRILAISTKDGQIKLLGKDNTQALLQPDDMLASKFLQFLDNRGILLRVTTNNHIEVWDIDRKLLAYVHEFDQEITSFTVMQHSFFIYVGDSAGNVTVLRLDEDCHIEMMKYRIPFSASHVSSDKVAAGNAIIHILPQPMAESKRCLQYLSTPMMKIMYIEDFLEKRSRRRRDHVNHREKKRSWILLAFRDGTIVLWGIQDSKIIFSTGGGIQSVDHEKKSITAACWACPLGSKIAVGYSNGEIIIYSNFPSLLLTTDLTSRGQPMTANSPPCKLNLAFKIEKIPIASMKSIYSDGKATRLYIIGASDAASTDCVQVVLLNENTESRTIKLGLQLPERCLDMEVISGFTEKNKHKQGFLLLLGKSGHIYAYDDHLIEKYLLQYKSRSPSSIPQEVNIKLPFPNSRTTSALFITNNSCWLGSTYEDDMLVSRNFPSLLPFESKQINAAEFGGFAKIRNLCITGHNDGVINFWDFTRPSMLPLLSIRQQSEDYSSVSGAAITAVYFHSELRLLVSGDQRGMIHIYKFKPEPFATEISLFSLQGSSKKGNHHAIQSDECLKVAGAVISLNLSSNSGHLVVGSEQGYVSLIEIEGPTLMVQKHIVSELSTGIMSLQFGTCSFRGFNKKVLVVATMDSSVLALDGDSGDTLSSSMIHPKKPSKALFMQILDGQQTQSNHTNVPDNLLDSGKAISVDEMLKLSLLLLCSERAVYVYSFTHIIQGIKKVCYRKKFISSSCCWASTFGSPSCLGLALLFTCGKIEIRSLPELHLVKETKARTFSYSSETSICCSSEGELVVVRNDQEIYILSLLSRDESYRNLDCFSRVYNKNLTVSTEGVTSVNINQKEKKKGIFGSVIEDLKGTKTTHGDGVAAEDVSSSSEELSTVFSQSNFPDDANNTNNLAAVDVDLDIDDIDLDDPEDKPKGGRKPNVIGVLKNQKLTSRLLSFKGKSKQTKVENERISPPVEPQKIYKEGAVDQIKKKYGYGSPSESYNFAELAKNKLNENMKKLQDINMRSTDMQENAQSFSSMAKDLLHTFERNKQNL